MPDEKFPLPESQIRIGIMINSLAARFAAGGLLSLFAVGETVDGLHMYASTPPENAYARSAFLMSCALNQMGFYEQNTSFRTLPPPGQQLPPLKEEDEDDSNT